jgi:hypothetical protein
MNVSASMALSGGSRPDMLYPLVLWTEWIAEVAALRRSLWNPAAPRPR